MMNALKKINGNAAWIALAIQLATFVFFSGKMFAELTALKIEMAEMRATLNLRIRTRDEGDIIIKGFTDTDVRHDKSLEDHEARLRRMERVR